ncbi:hypothetical protein [Methanospirillum lacunae]|uniref:hypothetical protein n=1 Tax=Methanospirillum lacunae TaxID=668570 RepID=UPI00374216E7
MYEDDGIGISLEEKERIFEKGFGKNTGFGLFLTREIHSIIHISIKETGSSPGGVGFNWIFQRLSAGKECITIQIP